jgi:hypothetical protein
VGKTFSLQEIEELEKKYKAAFQIRVLDKGKWSYVDPIPGQMDHIEGTRAERVKVRDHKSFTEYLRGIYA